MNHLLLDLVWFAFAFFASTHASSDSPSFSSRRALNVFHELPEAMVIPGAPFATPVPSLTAASRLLRLGAPGSSAPPPTTLPTPPPPQLTPTPTASPTPRPSPTPTPTPTPLTPSTAPPTPTTRWPPTPTTAPPTPTMPPPTTTNSTGPLAHSTAIFPTTPGASSASPNASTETVAPRTDNHYDSKHSTAPELNLTIVIIAVVGGIVVLSVACLVVGSRRRQAQHQLGRHTFLDKHGTCSLLSVSVMEHAGTSVEMASLSSDPNQSSPKCHFNNHINDSPDHELVCLNHAKAAMSRSAPPLGAVGSSSKDNPTSIYSIGQRRRQSIGALWPVTATDLFLQDSRFSDSCYLSASAGELAAPSLSDATDRRASSVVCYSVASDCSASGSSAEFIMLDHRSFMESLADHDRQVLQERWSAHQSSLGDLEITSEDDQVWTPHDRVQSAVYL